MGLQRTEDLLSHGFRFTLRSPPLPCLDSPSHTWPRLLWRIPTGVLAWQAVVEGAWRPRKGFLWMGLQQAESPRLFTLPGGDTNIWC